MRLKALPAVAVAVWLLLSACGSTTQPTPTLSALVVSCDATRLTSFGQQAHCTARVTLSNGQIDDRTAAAQWSSSDPGKLTVNGGVVSAVAAGTADVTAKVDTLTSKQTLTIDVGCAFSLSPTAASFGAAGGSQPVTVSAAPAGCGPAAWTASSNNGGLSVSPASGSGSGQVMVTAAANSGAPQTWTATIAGQTFTATVAAVCTVAFTPVSPDGGSNAWHVGAGAGERAVAVSVDNGPCGSWTASSPDNWISVSPTDGTGNATVRLAFAANAGGTRTGSVRFRSPTSGADTTTFITQAAATATLSLTLLEGEQLSGPYWGTARGPNGFSCTQTGATTVCPPLTVSSGTSVAIVVTLDFPTFPGPRPIFRATGCDTLTSTTCTVLMNTDRAVSISVGCDVLCGGLLNSALAAAEADEPFAGPGAPTAMRTCANAGVLFGTVRSADSCQSRSCPENLDATRPWPWLWPHSMCRGLERRSAMVRKASPQRVNSHHTLVTDAWTADVQALEAGIGSFAVPPAEDYHVSLFEISGDSQLHVNVTHRQQTRAVKGWSGPGVSANGFIHNRTFQDAPTADILRSIRQMVFAAPA